MESILYRMRDAAQQYVEVLSRIVGIDVSILDDRQMRIAGSGRMKKRTGSMVNFGNIMRHAIETKEIAVVTDPVVNALCAECPSKDHCDNLAEIWAPILMDEKVIGVIGCVCYEEKQKEKLLRNRDLYAVFFTQFASLIAGQAGTLADADRRKSIQKLLEHSLSLAQIGILILDADGSVYKINRAGREILWLDDSVPYSEISLTQNPGEDPKEYTVSFGGQMRRIVADIYHVGMDRCDRLMLFGSAELRTDLSDGILGLKPQRRRGFWRRRKAALSFWMRSAICLSQSRLNSCAYWSSERSCALAAIIRSPLMCASYLQPTEIWKRWCGRRRFERISSTESTWSRSLFRPCGNATVISV